MLISLRGQTVNSFPLDSELILMTVIFFIFQVAWRPFNIQSFRYQGCSMRKFLNIIYTLIIFVLIIFSYVSSILACQARLEIPLVCSLKTY